MTAQTLPNYTASVPVQLEAMNPTTTSVCPVCGVDAELPQRYERTRNEAYQWQANWTTQTHLLIGQYPATDESRELRAQALALLSQAGELERTRQLASDLVVARNLAQERLESVEELLGAERENLAAHDRREARLAVLAGDREELASRLESAQQHRTDVDGLSERVAVETEVVALERLISNIDNESQSLRVPFDAAVVQRRADELAVDAATLRACVADPEKALGALTDELREQWGSNLQQAIDQRILPVSAVAFGGK